MFSNGGSFLYCGRFWGQNLLKSFQFPLSAGQILGFQIIHRVQNVWLKEERKHHSRPIPWNSHISGQTPGWLVKIVTPIFYGCRRLVHSSLCLERALSANSCFSDSTKRKYYTVHCMNAFLNSCKNLNPTQLLYNLLWTALMLHPVEFIATF